MPLEPCEVHDTFEGIFPPDAVILRVVDHVTSPWHNAVNKMIFVATEGKLSLCDETGSSERDISVSDIESVVEQAGEVTTGLNKKALSQILFKMKPPNPDLLLHLVKDKRNVSSDTELFHTQLAEVLAGVPYERKAEQGLINTNDVAFDAKPAAAEEAPADPPSKTPTVASAPPKALSVPPVSAQASLAGSKPVTPQPTPPRSPAVRSEATAVSVPPQSVASARDRAASQVSAVSARSSQREAPPPSAAAPPSAAPVTPVLSRQATPQPTPLQATLTSVPVSTASRKKRPLRDVVLDALWLHRSQRGREPCREDSALLSGVREQMYHKDGVMVNKKDGIVAWGAVKKGSVSDEAFAKTAVEAMAGDAFGGDQLLAGEAVGVMITTIANKCYIVLKFDEVYHKARRMKTAASVSDSGKGRKEVAALKKKITTTEKRIASTEEQLRSASGQSAAATERQLAADLERLAREIQEQETQMAKMDETISVLQQRGENVSRSSGERSLGSIVPDVATLAKLREDIVKSNETILTKDTQIADMQRQLDSARDAILASAQNCFEKDVKLLVTNRSLKKFQDRKNGSASPRREAERIPYTPASPRHHVEVTRVESPRVSPPRQRWHLE